ncbi:MAG: GTP-binding protein [Oscillospiraceae bacterium]|nr:GTP-binding protein [Oscillospiraceae bacterium]
MTKIDIFSGFLGAGKTTLIRKLIAEGYPDEKLVLIENEFGEIAVDGAFLQDAGVQITEMNSGCICCTLVGDFTKALSQVIADYAPDRVLIEPSGVGKLSDVAHAVERVDGAEIGAKVTVVDAGKCKMYARNFGEFFNDQVENADLIVLSRTDTADDAKTLAAAALLKELNAAARLITTPWDRLNGAQIREAMEENTLQRELQEMAHEHQHHHEHHHHENGECCCHEHEHEHHHGDGECCCHEHEHEHHHHEEGECCCHEHEHEHQHHEDGECCCHEHDHEHEHHHHHEDGECCCHEHEHEHEHHHGDGECCCHGHHHEHEHHHEDGECDDPNCSCHHHEHGHHHADEIFTSWGVETARKFSEDELRAALAALQDETRYGMVLRAKGLVDAGDGSWIYFDYVPGETDIRRGGAAVIGRLCVIGSRIEEQALKELFQI